MRDEDVDVLGEEHEASKPGHHRLCYTLIDPATTCHCRVLYRAERDLEERDAYMSQWA